LIGAVGLYGLCPGCLLQTPGQPLQPPATWSTPSRSYGPLAPLANWRPPFERHDQRQCLSCRPHCDDYHRLVERRIALIETDRNIGLIEQPEYKRRWNTEPWEVQLERALRTWLLDRLERSFD
jgi:hypothetical protein